MPLLLCDKSLSCLLSEISNYLPNEIRNDLWPKTVLMRVEVDKPPLVRWHLTSKPAFKTVMYVEDFTV